MKNITIGLVIALLAIPSTIIAYGPFNYQPTDVSQYQDIVSIDARVAELDDMIASLEAEREALLSARTELQEDEYTQLQSAVHDLLEQVEGLGGDTSGYPDASERALMSQDELQQLINDLLAQIATLQGEQNDVGVIIGDISLSTNPVTYGQPVTIDWSLAGDISSKNMVCLTMKGLNDDKPYAPYPSCQPAVKGDNSLTWTLQNWPPTNQYRITIRVLDEDDGTGKDSNAIAIRQSDWFTLTTTDNSTEPGDDNNLRDTDGDGWIYGTDGDDYYYGDDSEQILVGSAGNDHMYGGGDWDEVNYVGPTDCESNFTISFKDGSDSVVMILYSNTIYATVPV
jgi:ElaB/YqjD/DUF883 family membrane-anchored ribosome-binding protein